MGYYSTIIIVVVSGAVFAFARNVQRQVDNLERRYENDYVSVKDNLRELWDSIDQLETVCKVSAETSTQPNTVIPKPKQPQVQYKSAVTSPIYVTQLALGLSQEKEFVRNSLNDITDSIIQMNNNFTNTVSEKMNYINGIGEKCNGVENEIENVHKKQDRMLVMIAETRNTMEAEFDGLRLMINKALEEALQNSILNKPASCIDLANTGVTSSGVYTLHYKMQPFTVYCLMNENSGYTFISPETYIHVDIKSMSNDDSHIVIRHRRTNGLQYETRIEQISRYKSRPVSVQYNAHTGYTGVVNNQMTPYIYVGLNPLKLENGRSHKGDIQGYKSNGKDFTFVNCDGNPNGYFAFLFNHNNVATPRRGESAAISRKWIGSSTRVTGDILPDKFMSFLELHFGGCGAYAGTNNFGEVTGAALGIPYTLP